VGLHLRVLLLLLLLLRNSGEQYLLLLNDLALKEFFIRLIRGLRKALGLVLSLVAGGGRHASRTLGGATGDTVHELIAILHVDVDF